MRYSVKALRKLNLGAGCLHLASAIALIVFVMDYLCKNEDRVKTATYTIADGDLKKDVSSTAGVVASLVISLTIITAIFHFVVWFYKKYYRKAVEKTRNNYLRWVEYVITATMMTIAIAYRRVKHQ